MLFGFPPFLLFAHVGGGVFGWSIAFTEAFHCFGQCGEGVLDLFELRGCRLCGTSWGRDFTLADEFFDDWVCEEG